MLPASNAAPLYAETTRICDSLLGSMEAVLLPEHERRRMYVWVGKGTMVSLLPWYMNISLTKGHLVACTIQDFMKPSWGGLKFHEIS